MTTFEQLGLIAPILKAVKEQGYEHPTPIQAQAIPEAIQGRDVLGCAQTGTGKTAAFAIPILQRLEPLSHQQGKKKISALIITPTRELAVQIADNIMLYGKHINLRQVLIYGGVSQFKQEQALQRGVDIVIATPGRLLDLFDQGLINLKHIQTLVLDEADRMLDMGFINDIKQVIAEIPKERQTLFFSATMPAPIRKLANSILNDPLYIEIKPTTNSVDKIEQQLYFIDRKQKENLFVHLYNEEKMSKVIVFTRTKRGAESLSKKLHRAGISADAIHGDKSQNFRQKSLDKFRHGKIDVLVATDVAARGIDVDNISHVVNFDLPNEAETYVHRIGRTGRAGASGVAISFCQGDERNYLRDIQRLIKREIPVRKISNIPSAPVVNATAENNEHEMRLSGGNGGGGRGGNARGGNRGGFGGGGRGRSNGGGGRERNRYGNSRGGESRYKGERSERDHGNEERSGNRFNRSERTERVSQERDGNREDRGNRFGNNENRSSEPRREGGEQRFKRFTKKFGGGGGNRRRTSGGDRPRRD